MVRPPTLTESEPAGQPVTQAEPPPGADERCAACGAAMAGDQEWCLECGVARTVIQSPPDWRLGVAIVLAVVAVVVLVTIIVWP